MRRRRLIEVTSPPSRQDSSRHRLHGAEGGLMDAYEQNRKETVNSVIEGDAVCVALFKFMETRPE
jgi:hypothetical protein